MGRQHHRLLDPTGDPGRRHINGDRRFRGLSYSQPLRPSTPATTNIHSGLMRVKNAIAAVTAVMRPAYTLWSAVRASTKALAAISPSESGTRPAWIAIRQCASLKRYQVRATRKATRQVGPHMAPVATAAQAKPAT